MASASPDLIELLDEAVEATELAVIEGRRSPEQAYANQVTGRLLSEIWREAKHRLGVQP